MRKREKQRGTVHVRNCSKKASLQFFAIGGMVDGIVVQCS